MKSLMGGTMKRDVLLSYYQPGIDHGIYIDVGK